MSAGKIPVERIANGGAKTPMADKLPSFGETLVSSPIPLSRVSIKLRASEHWSKVIKKRKLRVPRLRGIVRKQTTLVLSEMTLGRAFQMQRGSAAPPAAQSCSG